MIANASKIWIAKTMLHELIHAYIYQKLVSEGDGNLVPDDPNNFPALYDAYNINNGDFDHEYMATHYRNIMKSALQKYCQDAGIPINNVTLTAIVWSGLHNSTAWNNLPQDTQNTYSNIWRQELIAGGCP